MKIIAVMTQKGGVGKTMTASSLAYILGVEHGKRVLMEGTATISLKTLDELRAKAEEAETEKKRSDWFVKKLMNCYGFDTEAYDKALKEIDNERNLTDKQCSKLVREAMVKHLKIVIDPEELKELIQEYIDEEASDEHLDIAKASMKELKQIQVVLKE